MSLDEGGGDLVVTKDGGEFLGIALEFDLHEWVWWLGEWGISRFLIVTIFEFSLLLLLSRDIDRLPLFAFEWLIGTAPIWLPIALAIAAWKVWIWYVRALYLSGREPVLLEVRMPREVTKSPRAMEIGLTQLWLNSGETTFFHRWWKGQVRPFFSFEIASFGGEIHFYIWTWGRMRSVVENVLYAQYPEVEIVEVQDYASKFRVDTKNYLYYCSDWRLEPRNDAYPTKTYIDFELDKDPKEEFKVDPLANILEMMSNIGPKEQLWVQIIVTLNKDKRRKPGTLFAAEERWENLLKDEVQKIRMDSFIKTPEGQSRPMPSWRQTEQMRAIERNMGKLPFNIGARGVYFAESSHFHSPNITEMRWLWRPIANPIYLNQWRPRRWHNPFDYPWQDWKNIRWDLMTRRFFDAYRRRSFFYAPWATPHNMVSPEVIATMWHPPSSAIKVPGLRRISAVKAEPPPNLPLYMTRETPPVAGE